MGARLALGVAILLPHAAGALTLEAREVADCVALYAALGPKRLDAPPTEIVALDAEALAFRTAAIRLGRGNGARVDAYIREQASVLSDLRMNPDTIGTDVEDAKELERARLGSLCNDIGERLPETRRFFFPERAD